MSKETYTQKEQRKYEMFKLFWMMSNGYSVKDLVDSVLKYRSELEEDMWDDPDGLDVLDINLFANWEAECGFGGNIWPCMDEFMDVDYPILTSDSTIFEDKLLLFGKRGKKIC